MQRFLASINDLGIPDRLPIFLRVVNTNKGTENMQSTFNSAVGLKTKPKLVVSKNHYIKTN